MEAIWRVGREVGRTIYIQRGQRPSDSDELIGMMDTPEMARMVVEAVNAFRHVQLLEAPDGGSYDGGFGPESYYAHAMAKDD